MRSIHRLPLQGKLALITALAVGASLLITSVVFVTRELNASRQRTRDSMTTLGDVLGNNCAPAILFEDSQAAGEILSALSATPNIIRARVYGDRNEEVARYDRPDAPARGRAIGTPFGRSLLKSDPIAVRRPIVIDGRTIGWVQLQGLPRSIWDQLAELGLTLALALVAALTAAMAAFVGAQRMVSGPLQRLVSAAREVITRRDYSVRVPQTTHDETGVLTASFNEMLTQIQAQDGALRQAGTELEARILDLQNEISQRQEAEAALRHSEEQLRQSQKMEAVGKLAGGVAHDFNNLLTAIRGYSQLLLMKKNLPPEAVNNLEEIIKASDRAAGLTRQLLAFSRKQILEMKVHDMNDIVVNMEKMLRRLIGEDVELRTVRSQEPARIQADVGQIEQVLLNLVVNARDAMPRGGSLTIDVSRVSLDRDYVHEISDLRAGPHVLVSVSDTGCGMAPDVVSRIFEPFFTTKEQGKGTGLGLSTVYGIVKQTGGHVAVYTELGVGTTFHIYFPEVAVGEVSVTAPEDQPAAAAGSGRILLAEDESAVRALATEVLQHYGYEVVATGNGLETISAVENDPRPFDLMITDVIMPGMNGHDLYSRISGHQPGLKVLFMSGYTETAIVHHGVLDEGTEFIHKPFSPQALVLKVQSILRRSAAERAAA